MWLDTLLRRSQRVFGYLTKLTLQFQDLEYQRRYTLKLSLKKCHFLSPWQQLWLGTLLPAHRDLIGYLGKHRISPKIRNYATLVYHSSLHIGSIQMFMKYLSRAWKLHFWLSNICLLYLIQFSMELNSLDLNHLDQD